MPNLVDNLITVEGSPEELQALLEALRGGQAGQDLLALIPPEDLQYDLDSFAESWSLLVESGWGPALADTRELSERFPGLTFRHDYEEPGSDFSGYDIYRGGELLERAQGRYGDYRIWDDSSYEGLEGGDEEQEWEEEDDE